MKISKATIPFDPFPAQQRIMGAFENHRFVVVNHGNRFGGTRVMLACGIKYFVDVLNEHRTVEDGVSPRWVILTPTENLGKQMWRELKRMFPQKWVMYCSDTDKEIITINGGIIELSGGDYSFGSGIDLFTVDMANRFKDLKPIVANIEACVNAPLRGLDVDRGKYKHGCGKAFFCGSPATNPDFYDIYMRGQEDSEGYEYGWWSDSFPWTNNLVNAELANQVIKTKDGEITYADRIRKMIGDRMYRMNYLAEFVD